MGRGPRARPFGLPELEALRTPPVQSAQPPSSSARLPVEINMPQSLQNPLEGPVPQSPRFSQAQLKHMYEKQKRTQLSPPQSPRFSQEQLREMHEEQQRNPGGSTTRPALSVPLRLTVETAGDAATSPRILVVMKTWSADSTAPPIHAGEVCSLVREGTNGWILVLLSTYKLAWIPKSYAQIFDAFSYQVPANVGADGYLQVPVPRPQADHIKEAIARATTKSASC